MTKKIYRFLFVGFFGLLVTFIAQAQPNLTVFTDVGDNYVSDGLFLKATGEGAWRLNKTEIKAACKFNLINENPTIFSGIRINLSHNLAIKNFSFTLQGFYLYNRISELIYESNFGILAQTKQTHFVYAIGTNFRIYSPTKKAEDKYNADTKNKINENWNLIYLIGYYYKPFDYKWNVGLNLTNIDYFEIEQQTNPVFYLKGNYKLSGPVDLFGEIWYKSAGAFNLSVNYFGYFFRTGIIWHINN